MPKQSVKDSRYLSYILRHRPDDIGLRLDSAGWASVDELIAAARRHGRYLDRRTIEDIVASDDKGRFALSADRQKIRANQGHSIEVDLGLEATKPPQFLYHGTARRFIEAIFQQGLLPSGRQHVHLSADVATALTVGKRHGKPVVLRINAQQMHGDGFDFYLSENHVWLTDAVDPKYLSVMQAHD